MSNHPANNGKVMLTAWVDPEVRDLAREWAKELGESLSEFIAESVQQRFNAIERVNAMCAIESRGGK